jgi:hypothetical protein
MPRRNSNAKNQKESYKPLNVVAVLRSLPSLGSGKRLTVPAKHTESTS